jgi:hypothetical protein
MHAIYLNYFLRNVGDLLIMAVIDTNLQRSYFIIKKLFYLMEFNVEITYYRLFEPLTSNMVQDRKPRQNCLVSLSRISCLVIKFHVSDCVNQYPFHGSAYPHAAAQVPCRPNKSKLMVALR